MTGSAVPPDVVADAAAAASAWLRAADGSEAATIAGLATTAIVLAEAFCGQAFVARDFEDGLAPCGAWQALMSAPVSAITSVSAVDAESVATALSPDAYAIDIDAAGIGWVRQATPVDTTRLVVTYTAGSATRWADLPAPVAQGIAMLVAHLFDSRDGGDPPPAAIAALWRPWRRIGLARERHA